MAQPFGGGSKMSTQETSSFSNIIAKTIKMEDAAIQKLWIDTLFRGATIVKLMSYIRLSFCMLNDTFLNVKF